jgi:hypothetical protein
LNDYRYDPVVTGIFVGFAILILWFYSSIAIENEVLPIYFDYLMRFITVLIATLTGAFSAFQFNRHIENEKQDKLLVENLRHTNFLVAVKLNQLRGLKLNYLDPFEIHEFRWGVMKACAVVNEKADISFENLSFLHDESPTLLMELDLAQESYKLSIQLLNARSVLHNEQLQKAQAVHRKESGAKVTYQTLAGVIDDHLRETMKTATDVCYTIIPESIECLVKVQKEMLDVSNKAFPNIVFFDHNQMYEKGPI